MDVREKVEESRKRGNEMTITEWRKKHRRCRYCIYYEITPCGYGSCKAKDKILWLEISGAFCKLFKMKEY